MVPLKARCDIPPIKQIRPSYLRRPELTPHQFNQEISHVHKQEEVENNLWFERDHVLVE